MSDYPDSIDEKRYLGKLCPRGHDADGSGRSLRYRSNQACISCADEKRWGGPVNRYAMERRPLPGKRYSQADVDRFWAKVEKTDSCWLFHSWNTQGYPYVFFAGDDMRASHISVELHTGKQVPTGLVVAHRCDNPPCVNPEHLWVTTQLENLKDRDQKGHTAKGAAHSNFGRHDSVGRMTDSEVEEVRRLRTEGVNTLEICRRVGRSKGAILAIINGRSHAQRPKRNARTSWEHRPEFTDDSVRQVLALSQKGVSERAIASACGVTRTAVRQVLSGKIRKHITQPS